MIVRSSLLLEGLVVGGNSKVRGTAVERSGKMETEGGAAVADGEGDAAAGCLRLCGRRSSRWSAGAERRNK